MNTFTLVVWSVFLAVTIASFFLGIAIAFARFVDRHFGE